MTDMPAVLVVDDERDICTLVATVLQMNGYAVITAASGEEALAVFAEHDSEIDFLVSDIRMPGMTGPELAERLLMRRPDLPVVFMSGTEPAAAGGYPMLPKPFTANQLTLCLREAMHSS